jgi:hypothetical protein
MVPMTYEFLVSQGTAMGTCIQDFLDELFSVGGATKQRCNLSLAA